MLTVMRRRQAGKEAYGERAFQCQNWDEGGILKMMGEAPMARVCRGKWGQGTESLQPHPQGLKQSW